MSRTVLLSISSVIALNLVACSGSEPAGHTAAPTNGAAPAPSPSPSASPTVAVAPAPQGFDPASAPLATPSLGAFPFFSLIDGYVAMTRENSPGDSTKDYLKDVKFDQYEFFDGFKLIPVEGRLMTTRATGKGASFFEAKKTYEKLVRDQGGVTVFEGSGKIMADKKIEFADRRHRAYYVEQEDMGVYMIRSADREIWVEVYKPYSNAADNYWLTIVEKKTLDARARLLPAEEMKKALDASGRVALYFNFDTDKTEMTPASAPLIGEVVKLMTASPELKLTVEGHTDNAGTPTHNDRLSLGRARAVVAALIARGMAADRLEAKGLGQSKPLADNAAEEGRATNRRVELVKR